MDGSDKEDSISIDTEYRKRLLGYDGARQRLTARDQELTMMLDPTFRVYSFDKAMRATINKNYKNQSDLGCCQRFWLHLTCGAAFQALFVAIFILQCLVPILIEKLLPLLEK